MIVVMNELLSLHDWLDQAAMVISILRVVEYCSGMM